MWTLLSLLLLLSSSSLPSPSLILMMYYYYYYYYNKTMLGFLATGTMECTVFWDVMPCSPVEVHWHFREVYSICLKDQTVSHQEAGGNLISVCHTL
jgi:hypothetical protein